MKINQLALTSLLLVTIFAPTLPAQERITDLYTSPAGIGIIPVIAKEAKYLEREELAREFVRTGGSKQIIHANRPASAPAVQRRKNSPQGDFGF